ncbi:DUF4920 domain-containing protein [Mucilaginibacter litoreus]|uniref:DUF4920 domain-containing protein n=1 Tax=Mucilaginibacter litoreus TaxID=1048221 RepID=A0ABW3AZ18_9SPHI
MRYLSILYLILVSVTCFAQKHTPLPHGMIFGNKPNAIAPIAATDIERSMGGKIRQTTAIIGKIIKVKREAGGWFLMDAGNGRVIDAHFANYNIHLPEAIEGRTVIIEGVAQRRLIADDAQHFAGDTVHGKKQHKEKVDPKERIIFEVQGLVVDK